MSSNYLGRLVGKTVSELCFRCLYNTPLSIGGIAMVDDPEVKRKYLLRITNISYGHESAEANWAEKAAGRMIEEDIKGESYRIHDAERRLYKLVTCSPLGFVADGQFHRPRSIPTHFSLVSLPDQETMVFLRDYSGDLIVGDLRCGETVMDIPLGIEGSALAQHIGIFATTGMGKSNLMKVLAAAIMEKESYGLLIFDPHGEYHDGGKSGGRKGLVDHPLADRRLFTYTTRKLKGNFSALKIPISEIEIEDIAQIFSFSQAQYEALHAIGYKYGKAWLETLIKGDLATLAEELGSGHMSFHESTLGVILRRAERVAGFGTVTRDNSLSTVGDVIGKLQRGYTVLIDTANLSQAEETIIGSVLTRSVLKSYRTKYQSADDFDHLCPSLILIEEAQRVLSASTGDSNIFYQVAREGRKFKVGLGVVTQQPKLLSEELLSQLNSIFILGLADERDRAIVRSSAKQDISALGTEIQTLSAGEALLTSPSVPFALPLKIYLYEDYLRRVDGHAGKRATSQVDDKFFGP